MSQKMIHNEDKSSTAGKLPSGVSSQLNPSSNYKSIQQQYISLHKHAMSYYHSLNEYMLTPVASYYFKKAFSLFQELWLMQQKYRKVLMRPPLLLKREDIGMIALHIAQLYYQNYIRTSNSRFLLQAFEFFDAVEERGYFKDILILNSQENSGELSDLSSLQAESATGLERIEVSHHDGEVQKHISNKKHIENLHLLRGTPVHSEKSTSSIRNVSQNKNWSHDKNDKRDDSHPSGDLRPTDSSTSSYAEYTIETVGESISNLKLETSHYRSRQINRTIQSIHKAHNTVLRYYARFIMTCLFLNKKAHIHTVLLPNMKAVLAKYDAALATHSKHQQHSQDDHASNTASNADPNSTSQLDSHLFHATQWHVVIQELETFLLCDSFLKIENDLDLLSFRQITANQFNRNAHDINPINLTRTDNEIDHKEGQVKLSNACLITNTSQQIKFSELSITMYRIMLFLEILPPCERKSPEKIFLNRPTFTQAIDAFNSCFKKNSGTQGSLLYLQMDGFEEALVLEEENEPPYTDCNKLYIDDIIPFTRKPLFLIIDTDTNFKWDPTRLRPFSVPFVCLLNRKSVQDIDSKTFLPTEGSKAKDKTNLSVAEGDLFSYYLSNPIVTFLTTSGITDISLNQYKRMDNVMKETFHIVSQSIQAIPEVPSSYISFLTDPFTEALVLRFLFYCFIVQYSLPNIELPTHYPSLPYDSILSLESNVSKSFSNLLQVWKEIISIDTL